MTYTNIYHDHTLSMHLILENHFHQGPGPGPVESLAASAMDIRLSNGSSENDHVFYMDVTLFQKSVVWICEILAVESYNMMISYIYIYIYIV